MGCDTYLIRSTESEYDHKTKTSQITEQIIWEGRGAELGIHCSSWLDGQLRGTIDLERLRSFADEYNPNNGFEEEQVNELLEVKQTQLTQTEYPLNDTDFRLEISY